MNIAKITDAGGQPSIPLPPEALEQLNAAIGDLIQIIPEEGGVMLRRVGDADTGTQRQKEIAAHIIEEREDVLRRVAE
ncbi:MAG: hypothetical protein CMJ58_21620 [Planctomycetaceae bacterium]|nr:hypothetical protein [Planctomycetaceae bacterium]